MDCDIVPATEEDWPWIVGGSLAMLRANAYPEDLRGQDPEETRRSRPAMSQVHGLGGRVLDLGQALVRRLPAGEQRQERGTKKRDIAPAAEGDCAWIAEGSPGHGPGHLVLPHRWLS